MTTKILNGIYAVTYNLNSPVNNLSITATGYLNAGLVAAGAGSYNVNNAGIVRGKYEGVSLAGGGTVTNSGTIVSYSTTTSGGGVILGNGGTVSNAATGSITGYYGVEIALQSGTVNNQGLIIGYEKAGVYLAAGGQVTNGSATNTTATVRGLAGIESKLAATTVHNFGTVVGMGTSSAGAYLAGGGVFINGSSADTKALVGGNSIGVVFAGGSGTIINYGTMVTTGTAGAAVALEAGGVLTNGSATDTTAFIQGAGKYAVASIGQAATVTNFGTVVAAYYNSSAGAVAVYLKNGGIVTNGTTSDTTAHLAATIGVGVVGAFATVTNFATIGGALTEIGVIVTGGGIITNGSTTDTTALIQGYIGAAGQNVAATVVNFGTILGGRGPGTIASMEAAVLLVNGGSVTNGSSADTKALLQGVVGVGSETIASTVTNFGSISGSQIGIELAAGGKVTNGTATDTTATISAGLAGVFVEAVGTVTNFGTIRGSMAKYFAVSLAAGGVITNGSSTDHVALIKGFVGIEATTGAKITNNGTIEGVNFIGSYGAAFGDGSSLTNSAGALISGFTGVDVGATSTLNNFGTIQGLGVYAVAMIDPTARLNAEAGSTFVGTISAGGGVVDMVGGVATASAITSGGKIEGVGTLLLNGGTSFFDAGVSLLVSKIELAGPTTTAKVETKVSDSRIWDQTAGTLFVDTGDQITFTGAANSLSGTVSGPGAVLFSGGADTLSDVTLEAGKMTISKSAVTLSGVIDLTGTLSVTTPNLIVAAGGASLTGGGTISLSNTSTNSLHGASAAATLTNGDIIRGAGKLGGGTMTLINTAAGTIESAGSLALTVDTGTNSITNAGVIEALSGGGMVVKSAVNNTGTLTSNNGTLIVTGAVTGAGTVRVIGGAVGFASTVSENVTFGSTGRLILNHSQTYGGTISSFSHTGTTSLDLTDIAFSGGTTATYSGTAAGGVLTVSDGTHTANIHLKGDYTAATWTLSAATGGGTHVVDPTPAKPIAAPLITAMAGFGASHVAATALSSQAWMTAPPMLAAPSALRT